LSIVSWAGALGGLAAIAQVAAYLVYLRLFLAGAIRPNAASWFMFAYGTGLMAFLEFALPSACGSMSVLVAALCFRKKAFHAIDTSEKITFGIDVTLTVLYAALAISGHNKFVVAFLVVSTVTTVTSFAPVLRSTWEMPEREHSLPWAMWTVAYGLLLAATLLAVGFQSPALLLYPVSCVGLHGLIALFSRPSRQRSLALSTSRAQRKERVADTRIMETATTETEIVRIEPSAISGRGVHASVDFNAGQEIWELTGAILLNVATDAEPNAIGIGRDVWIDPEYPLVFLNHSCEPNSAFASERTLISLRPITAGEEITMDYSATEADVDWTMHCSCGASECRGVLRPIQIAFADSKEMPQASPMMQQVWQEEHMQHRSTVPNQTLPNPTVPNPTVPNPMGTIDLTASEHEPART
jgi:uncharacterized protein